MTLTKSIMLDMSVRDYRPNNAVRLTIKENAMATSGIVTYFRAAVPLRRKNDTDKFRTFVKNSRPRGISSSTPSEGRGTCRATHLQMTLSFSSRACSTCGQQRWHASCRANHLKTLIKGILVLRDSTAWGAFWLPQSWVHQSRRCRLL